MIDLSFLDYVLPEHLIARYPRTKRDEARLLWVDPKQDRCYEAPFRALLDFLNPGDCLVLNNTKVLKARLFAKKITGGVVELFFERLLTPTSFLAMTTANKPLKEGSSLWIAGYEIQLVKRQQQFMVCELICKESPIDILQLLALYGETPIPPYFKRRADAIDDERYQTVFAKEEGAVAAPTAGLHFTEALLAEIQSKGVHVHEVTLHVGLGTFGSLTAAQLESGLLHEERYSIPPSTLDAVDRAKAMGHRVVAVGTTAMRALESCYRDTVRAAMGNTQLFIRPGFEFQIVDALLTNFHVPKSSLLMLVAAFSGQAMQKKAYAHAIEQEFYFYSYGDAMLITGKG